LQGPTLEDLAAEIAPQLLAPGKSVDAGKAGPAVAEYPLSFTQQTQWFGHKLARFITFNVTFTAGVSPALNWERLPAGGSQVSGTSSRAAHHRGGNSGRASHAAVLTSTTSDLTLIDATGWTEENLKQRVMEEFSPGFQIDRPMVRIRVFRCAGQDVMLFVVDHLIIDASSLQICFEDLKRLYPAELTGSDAGLKPLRGGLPRFREMGSQPESKAPNRNGSGITGRPRCR